jgi:type I restriction-modification system DNA methylase subunit
LPATAFFSSEVKGGGELGEHFIKDEHLDVSFRLLLFPEAILDPACGSGGMFATAQ